MPVISMFYGVIVLMYYFDNKKHHRPHIHVEYSDEEAVVSIPDGGVIEVLFELRNSNLCRLGLRFTRTN